MSRRPSAALAVDWLWPDLYGGAYRVAWECALALQELGHDVTILGRAKSPEAAGVQRLDTGLTCVRYWPERHLSPIRSHYLGLRRALEGTSVARNVDLLHTHTLLPGLAALNLFRASRHVHTVHSPAGEEARYNRPQTGRAGYLWNRVLRPRVLDALDRSLQRKADMIHVLSGFTKSLLAREVQARTAIVPWWSSMTGEPSGPREGIRTRLGIRPDDFVLLTVRRLVPRMGLDILLRAALELARDTPFTLLIAGEGPERGRLEEIARPLMASGTVRFLGSVDDQALRDLYAAADLFVLPTQALECFGIIAVEAMAAGLPVIGSAVGAIPEVLALNRQNVVLSEFSSPAAWTRALRSAITPRSPGDLEALAATARDTYSRARVLASMRDRVWAT